MIPNVLSMIPHVLSMMSFGTLYKAASPSFERQNFEKFLLAKSCQGGSPATGPRREVVFFVQRVCKNLCIHAS
jgi:hypothetical protein